MPSWKPLCHACDQFPCGSSGDHAPGGGGPSCACTASAVPPDNARPKIKPLRFLNFSLLSPFTFVGFQLFPVYWDACILPQQARSTRKKFAALAGNRLGAPSEENSFCSRKPVHPPIPAPRRPGNRRESTRPCATTTRNRQPITHVPARRAVRISTLESPIISVSPGATPASRITVFSPSGSGFLLAKLLPP